MSNALARWNDLSEEDAEQEILTCCGSTAWARELASRRPISDESALVSASDQIWNRLGAQDWSEAFAKHPRIGEGTAPALASAQSAAWSAEEQQNVASAGKDARLPLRLANGEYERRFGRVFIVCATGKSADEMLDLLRRRLGNDDASELREAAEQQRKITNLRLRKWLAQ